MFLKCKLLKKIQKRTTKIDKLNKIPQKYFHKINLSYSLSKHNFNNWCIKFFTKKNKTKIFKAWAEQVKYSSSLNKNVTNEQTRHNG